MFGFFKKRSADAPGPALDAIDTRAKAEALCRAGSLGKLLMRPSEFGGQDDPLNAVYVPPGILVQKADIDLQAIKPLAAAGKVTKYAVQPEYQGKSIVPIAIKITVSEPETFIFIINIWGTAIEREERNWDQVYAAREAIYAEHFGRIEGDVQKLMNLTGVWPGGCIVQIQFVTNQIWITSSFGLTNADMPARTRQEQFEVEKASDGSVRKYSMRIVARAPRPIPAGHAGYGYEMAVLTREKESWPLMFLNWAIQAEILRDADFPGKVRRYGALTIEDVSLGDGQSGDFLIAPIHRFAPSATTLPNGSMELLAATRITRAQMQFGVERGGRALLEQINERQQGQVSD